MTQIRIRKRSKTLSYIFEASKVDGKRNIVEKGSYPTKAETYKAGVAAYNDFLHGNIGITSIRREYFETIKRVTASSRRKNIFTLYTR